MFCSQCGNNYKMTQPLSNWNETFPSVVKKQSAKNSKLNEQRYCAYVYTCKFLCRV